MANDLVLNLYIVDEKRHYTRHWKLWMLDVDILYSTPWGAAVQLPCSLMTELFLYLCCRNPSVCVYQCVVLRMSLSSSG
jgi:hypothetical protein